MKKSWGPRSLPWFGEGPEEGLIDHMGLTSHSLDVMERALKDDRFAVVMVCYSFLEPDAARRIFPRGPGQGMWVSWS